MEQMEKSLLPPQAYKGARWNILIYGRERELFHNPETKEQTYGQTGKQEL